MAREDSQAHRHLYVALTLLSVLVLSGCDWLLEPQFERAQPRTDAEVTFAKSVLNNLQEISFRQDREYCGFIGLDNDGDYVATEAVRGEEDGCQPEEPDTDVAILASYHTHAAFSDGYDSERPSTIDLEADVAEGIDGYVATPGGRLWYNDAALGETRMICGSFCLIQDPRYEPFDDIPLETIYSLDELRERDRDVE
ncbi:MAG: DUF4329 domain-containing protein [Parasphingorhabdus sp.]